MYMAKAFTASATLTASDAGTPLVVNAAAGLTLTLPAAAGTGRSYEIIIGTTVTSNDVIVQVANASDVMTGMAIAANNGANTVDAWETASTSDTITMDGSDTGGTKGDRIYLRDIAANLWYVSILMAETGTTATPFSAAVG